MTVLVTGASSGFGSAIAKKFVESGYKVIGTARRGERLKELQTQLGDHFYPLVMDISIIESVDSALKSIPTKWNDIDLLVNNAGLALGLESAEKASFDDWLVMIQTNVIGLSYLTRQILPKMVKNKHGHIVNIGSVAGNYPYPGGNVYGATKAYVKQFSKNLRADLVKNKIRVSNIEPGLCGETEFSNVRFKGNDQKASSLYENVEYIKPEDIANIVLWVYQQPQYVNINSIEVMPVSQSFAPLHIEKGD